MNIRPVTRRGALVLSAALLAACATPAAAPMSVASPTAKSVSSCRNTFVVATFLSCNPPAPRPTST